MLAYQRGDTTAFEQLYRRHKDGLFAFLFRSQPRLAVVEELAQDSWMAVVNSAQRYKPEAKFRTWLYQIAHNRLIDHWRRPDNQHRQIDTTAEPLSSSDTPADSIENAALQVKIMAALAQLPREQKDALLLQEQGFSQAEIAEITGAGTQTIKSRLRYARNQLRDLLGDEQ